MNLDDQLETLKDIENRVEVPRQLEVRLLEVFDECQRSGVTGHRSGQRFEQRLSGQRIGHRYSRGGVLAALALAAGVIVGVTSTVIYFQRVPEVPTVAAEPVSESIVFVVEPPGVQETVRVMRIRVARSALESLGINTVASQGSGSASSDSVEVDLLVGEDGVARGVRLAM
jgi:hypothetical protein